MQAPPYHQVWRGTSRCIGLPHGGSPTPRSGHALTRNTCPHDWRVGGAFLLLLLLTGCAHKHAATVNTTNVLRVPLVGPPTTFDPAIVEDGTTIDLLQNIYEGLVQWSTDNKLVPCLAEKWDVSKDGKTYTFHIRKGAQFQDGAPVTADDVYYSFHRSLLPALKSTVALTYMGDILGAKEENSGKATTLAGVKVIDPQTVAVTLTSPKAYWLNTLTYPTAYIVSRKEATQSAIMSADDAAKGAGSGPFRVAGYVPDSKVTLTANAAYWDGAPKINGIERPVVTDASTRHALYVNGDLDILQYVQPGNLASDAHNPDLANQIRFFPRAATWYIGLASPVFPVLKDVRVRQALAYATDKQQIVQRVFDGKRDVAQDILPKGIPGFDPNFQGFPYDPAKARALLAAAGYPGGKGFPVVPMTYREGYPEVQSTVDLIRQQWQTNLGIVVQGRQTEYGKMLHLKDQKQLEAYHIRWAADYLDPQDYYSVLLRTGGNENTLGYSNPQYDALCDRADVEQDATKRFALYRQAADIAGREVPVIPLYYQQDPELIKPYVKGLDDCLMGHLPYKHLTLK